MKLKHLLISKRILIVSLAVLLALIVAIIILATSNSKDTGGKDTSSKIEQNKDDAVTGNNEDKIGENDKVDNSSQNDGSLEVLKPNEVAPGDSSDASGNWGEVDKQEESTKNDTLNDEEKEDDEEKPEKDILEDDITWGSIY